MAARRQGARRAAHAPLCGQRLCRRQCVRAPAARRSQGSQWSRWSIQCRDPPFSPPPPPPPLPRPTYAPCNASIAAAANATPTPPAPSTHTAATIAPVASPPSLPPCRCVAAAGECVWRQCCGEIARDGSARMSVATSAAAVCTPPPRRAHCARCDGDVLCVGGRRPLRRGLEAGRQAARRPGVRAEAAEAVGSAARQRQGRGSGGLGGLGGRCNRSRRARATMCSACVRLGGGRGRLVLRRERNAFREK